MIIQIIEWALALIASGGLGAGIMWLATFKSAKKQAEAQATGVEVEVELKREDLHQDLYDYLQKTCDKYIKDYHDLESDFRKQITLLRIEIDDMMKNKSKEISEKCNEIAKLKSEIRYLKGLSCYNFICQKRIKEDPENKQTCTSKSLPVL